MKSWLHDNVIEMYLTHNDKKCVAAERFLYKYMTAASKNVCTNRVDGIVNKYNKTYQITIKMKLADVQLDTYVDYRVEHQEKYPKFKVGNHVRTSKCKSILAEGYTSNWRNEFFVIQKIKNTLP